MIKIYSPLSFVSPFKFNLGGKSLGRTLGYTGVAGNGAGC